MPLGAARRERLLQHAWYRRKTPGRERRCVDRQRGLAAAAREVAVSVEDDERVVPSSTNEMTWIVER